LSHKSLENVNSKLNLNPSPKPQTINDNIQANCSLSLLAVQLQGLTGIR